MKITARLDALERKAAEAHDGNAGYRIFAQSADDANIFHAADNRVFTGGTLGSADLPHLRYTRAEIDALSAAGERCICIEYAERWPPGGE